MIVVTGVDSPQIYGSSGVADEQAETAQAPSDAAPVDESDDIDFVE